MLEVKIILTGSKLQLMLVRQSNLLSFDYHPNQRTILWSIFAQDDKVKIGHGRIVHYIQSSKHDLRS